MIVTRLQEGLLYHGNNRLINLAVGAVVMGCFGEDLVKYASERAD